MDAWIKEAVRQLIRENAENQLNDLIELSAEILDEANEIERETESSKTLIKELDVEMKWAEDQLESIRRDRNRAAIILWNFPDDYHPQINSPSPQDKMDTIEEFLIHTVGVPPEDAVFIGIEHVGSFFTNYKQQRSCNVRIQFVDEDTKFLCESFCIPWLKVFNQNRQSPTRWKDDQTELQREEIAKNEIQQQQQQLQQGTASATSGQPGPQGGPRPQRLLFTKVIRWPPNQKA